MSGWKLEHVQAQDAEWSVGRAGVALVNPDSGAGIMLRGRAEALATLQVIVATLQEQLDKEAARA